MTGAVLTRASLDEIAITTHARAAQLNATQAATLLADCAAELPAHVSWTEYTGGKTSTIDGAARCETFSAFGAELVAYASRVVEKGTGRWFMGAVSTNGRCRDADIEAITLLTLDCDGAGEWDRVRGVLDEARIAYVIQRSSSHTPASPKWHLTIPLARPWSGSKPTWRAIWRFVIGTLGGIAGLPCEPPMFGFDHATDRLGQPIFPAAKRAKEQAPPETIVVAQGAALDLDALLARGGFAAALIAEPPEPSTDHHTIDPSSPEGVRAVAWAKAYLASAEPAVEGQGGSGRLFAACCHLMRSALPLDTLRQLVEEVYNPRCEPPWSVKEIEHKLTDADRIDDKLRGLCPPGFSDRMLGRTTETSAPDAAGVADPEWGEPEPFDAVDLPAFPVDELSPWMRDWANAQAVFTQVPVDLPACLALGTASLAAARYYSLKVREGWPEPTNLWIAVAMPPAERKSPNFSEATAPLYAYSQHEAKRLASRISASEIERRVLEAQIKEAENAAVKGKPYDGGDALQAAQKLRAKLDDIGEIHPPVLLTDDCTPEALAILLSQQGERMGVFSAEGGPFEMMGGRYTDRGTNFEIFLKSHPGDSHTCHRVSRKSISLSHPLLTMVLTVQPSVIAGLAANDGFRGRGLLARFFYSLPKTALGRRATDPPAVDRDVRTTYQTAVASMLLLSGEPRILTFSSEADRARALFQAELEPRLGPDGDLNVIGDWAGKLVGGVCRIAGVLHASDWAGRDTEGGPLALKRAPPEIPVETFERATKIGRYFLAHALATFEAMGADENTELAKKVWAWVQRRQVATFTEREAARAVHAKPAAAIKPALAILLERRLVRLQAQRAHAVGRRPGDAFEVFPGGS